MLILLFVLIYKVGDAMGQGMLNPMIVELGFTDTEFIAINKLVGVAALIVGSALGAPFIAWLGMGRALWVSGLLMMCSNFLFAVLANVGHSPLMLGIAVGTENLTSGIGLTVFVTYLSGLSRLCVHRHPVRAAVELSRQVGRTWLATPSGILANSLGWVGSGCSRSVGGGSGAWRLLWILWRKGFVVESVRQTKAPPPPTEIRSAASANLVRHFAVRGEDFAREVERAGDQHRKAVVGQGGKRLADALGPLRCGAECHQAVAVAAFDRHRGHARQIAGERVHDRLRITVREHPNHEMQPLPGEVAADRQAGIGIMAAVEPYLVAGCQVRQRPRAEQLQASRPARVANAIRHGFGRNRDRVLVPQHRHRQRGVVGLVRADQLRQRQRERAEAVGVFDRFAGTRIPLAPAHEQRRASDLRALLDFVRGSIGIALRHQRRTGTRDPRLLERDPRQRIFGRAVLRHEQERLVVDPERGNAAARGVFEHVGRIEPPAEARLRSRRHRQACVRKAGRSPRW